MLRHIFFKRRCKKYFFRWQTIALQDPIILGLKYLSCMVQSCEDLMLLQLVVVCFVAESEGRQTFGTVAV